MVKWLSSSCFLYIKEGPFINVVCLHPRVSMPGYQQTVMKTHGNLNNLKGKSPGDEIEEKLTKLWKAIRKLNTVAKFLGRNSRCWINSSNTITVSNISSQTSHPMKIKRRNKISKICASYVRVSTHPSCF